MMQSKTAINFFSTSEMTRGMSALRPIRSGSQVERTAGVHESADVVISAASDVGFQSSDRQLAALRGRSRQWPELL